MGELKSEAYKKAIISNSDLLPCSQPWDDLFEVSKLSDNWNGYIDDHSYSISAVVDPIDDFEGIIDQDDGWFSSEKLKLSGN